MTPPLTPETKQIVGIADSEDEHRAALKSLLEAGGYQVVAYSDGAKLLAYFTGSGSKYTPSFVILDVKSSNVAGLEVARRFAADRRLLTVPVLMMAKHCSPEDNIEAQGAGAISCLQKPLMLPDIHLALADRKARDLEMKETVSGKFKINYE